MKTNLEQVEELEKRFYRRLYRRLCPICKKYPQNNCSKCNSIKQTILEAVNEMIDFLEDIKDDWIGRSLQQRILLRLKELKEEKKRLENKK